MLVNTNEGFLHSSGNFEKSNFTIKASSKAFSILSSALYQNKIRAIVRELSCNAIDAQKVSGSTEKFILQLPTHQTPTFRIRDFGPGISPEDIESVYTTYFESTKTMSNDMIGCLGLGSKTPFCYTDNFMVNSYHGGMKRSYAAAINEDGMPIISLVQEMPTTELSGLEVSFAVKTGDIPRFLEEAQFVCYWLSDKPKVLGHSQETVLSWAKDAAKTLTSGANWKIVYAEYYDRSKPIFHPFVIMGNVPYALSVDNIPNLTIEEKAVLNCSIHINVPIGSVEPQASRESLSYTKSTIAYLQNVVRDIVAEIKQVRQTEVAACKTYYDALLLCEEKKGEASTEPFSTLFKKFEFNNKHVYFPVQITPSAFGGTVSFSTGLQKSRRYGRGGNADTIVVKQIEERQIYAISKITFVSKESLATHPKGEDRARLMVKNWLLDNPDQAVDAKVFFVEKSVADHLELIDGETIFDYNKLPAFSRPATPRIKASQAGRVGKKKSEVWVVDTFDEPVDKKIEVDLEDMITEFVYVLLENKKLPLTTAARYSGYSWTELAGMLFVFAGKDVVGLTARQLAEVATLPNWKELRVAAKEKMVKVLANPKEIEESFEKTICRDQYDSQLLKDGDVLKMVALLKSTNPNHDVVQFTDKYKMTPSYSSGDKLSTFYDRMVRFLEPGAYNSSVGKGAFDSDYQFWADSYAEFTKIKNEVHKTCAKNKAAFKQEEVDLLAKYPIFKSVMAANGIDDFLLKEICTKCL